MDSSRHQQGSAFSRRKVRLSSIRQSICSWKMCRCVKTTSGSHYDGDGGAFSTTSWPSTGCATCVCTANKLVFFCIAGFVFALCLLIGRLPYAQHDVNNKWKTKYKNDQVMRGRLTYLANKLRMPSPPSTEKNS